MLLCTEIKGHSFCFTVKQATLNHILSKLLKTWEFFFIKINHLSQAKGKTHGERGVNYTKSYWYTKFKNGEMISVSTQLKGLSSAKEMTKWVKASYQAWPEFDLQGLYGRKEPTSTSCCLTSTCVPWYACTVK